MKLQFIRINNFKQFFGDHVAHFSMLEDKNVTIFHGKNGAGKTSLFSSITWCLYGEGEDSMGDLLNRQVLSEMIEGEEQPVVVTLCFRHDNEEYLAERVKYFTKVDGKPKSGKNNFSLNKIDASGQNKPQPNPEGKMNDILPNKVREYFFFDGEKMDELTKSGNKKIEEAIRNIMRLHILDNTEKHLREVYKEYRSEVQKQGSLNTAELIREQEELEAGIERFKEQIKEKQSEIHLAEKHIQDIEHTLEDSKGVGELQAERKQLQMGLENLDTEKSHTASSIWEKVNSLYPIFIQELLTKAQDKINYQVGKGKIPRGIQQ
ncbi:MAG: AAA family ATPase, partial [Porphyromonadaceae bacterium]|nr:AAA family ATPase [Porphyromonadaceae bacterium]